MAKKRHFRIPDEKRKAVIKAYASGMSTQAVADALCVGKSTVNDIVKDAGITRPRWPSMASKPQQPRRISAKVRDVQDVTRRPAENDNRPRVAVHPITATKGEWRALADYAKEHGITTAKAQQLWHQARMGVL